MSKVIKVYGAHGLNSAMDGYVDLPHAIYRSEDEVEGNQYNLVKPWWALDMGDGNAFLLEQWSGDEPEPYELEAEPEATTKPFDKHPADCGCVVCLH